MLCASDERFSAGNECVEKRTSKLHPHTATHVATVDFPTELLSGTYLRKRAVATLSYSPLSMLHPQVIYVIAYSAGLNGFEVDQVDRENNKRTSPYTPSSLYCKCSVVHVWPDFTCPAHTIIV